MGLLEIALTFLILVLTIFLAITGIQVFFILRDLKRALDKFNDILQTGENIVEDIEKPVAAASNLVTAAKSLGKIFKKSPRPKRFYKKVL